MSFIRQYGQWRLGSLVLKRALMYVIGGTATATGIYAEARKGGRRRTALVVPLPAAEGFKDPLLEDFLNECEEALGSAVITEGQSVEWLTQSITPMWPFLDEGLRQFLLDRIEPAIQDAVPIVGKKLRFSQLTLGTQVPALGPVMTELTDDGVELFVQAHYAGDLAVDFDVGVATVKLGHLTIDGEVLLAFKPIVDGVNPIGGLEICCLDQPDITLDLTTKGLFLDSVPNLYGLIQSAVDKVIAGVLVAPNNIAVRIPTVTGPETDRATLKYRQPLGVLRVTVDGADGLPGSRWTTDPYVRVQLGAAHWYSDTIFKTLQPRWADASGARRTQDFLVYHPRQRVHFELHDQNAISSDEMLALCRVPVRDLSKAGAYTLPLVSPGHRDLDGASLSVHSEWLPVAELDAATLAAVAPLQPPQPAAVSAAGGNGGWREGNAAGTGTELVSALRVDRLSGAALGQCPTRVRLQVGGAAAQSEVGRAPEPAVRLDDGRTAALARRLCAAGCGAAEAAAVLEVEGADYAAMQALEQARTGRNLLTRLPEVEKAEDKAWEKKVRAKQEQEGRCTQPVFEEVMYVPSQAADSFTLQVLREDGEEGDGGASAVLRERTFPMGATGPFDLDGCVVHGSLRMFGLRSQSVGEASAA